MADEKPDRLKVTVTPGGTTPGPPGGVEETAPPPGDPVTDLTRSQRGIQGILEQYRPGMLPHITDDEPGQGLYESLKPGQKFIDSKGEKFVKPWLVEDDSDFEHVPEGAQFVDKEGNRFTKPKFAPISATAQMLYETAQTPDAKEQALKTIYGEKVKKYPSGELYVDDNGTARKPGARDIGTFAATGAANVAPAVGMGLGSLAGPGGAIAGAAAGRQFNNSVLALIGIHQPVGEQISSSAWEGAGAGLGEVVGKVASAVPRAAKSVFSSAKDTGGKLYKRAGDIAGGALGDTLEAIGMTPKSTRGLLGLTEERAQQASGIADRLKPDAEGKFKSPLSPSVMFPEAPMLGKIEQFDRVFRAQNVFQEATKEFADQEAKSILENEAIGVKLTEPLSKATKQVSSRQAGHMLLVAAQRDLAHDDAMLEAIIREQATALEQRIGATAAGHSQRLAQLNAAHQQAAVDAERLIRAQAAQLRTDVDAAARIASHNEDPSALDRMIAANFEAYDTGVRGRARQMYEASRAVTRGAPPPNVGPLAAHAESFLRSMPESLRSRYPSEIADLARLVDRDVDIAGVSRRPNLNQGEPTQPIDWAGLHHLRSWLRHGIDYNDLTPDMRQGALRRFEREINTVLHDPNAPPQLRQAAQLLDQADAFYRQNIPFLNDQMVKAIVSSLESGAGVDAKVVAKTLFDPDRTAALRRARGIIGENGWRAVEAAHVQNMLQQSQTLVPGQYDFSKFSSQVLDQVRTGIIDTAYSPGMAARLRQLATHMGQFEGSIPISTDPSDTLSTIMRRGAAAKVAIDEASTVDPVKSLKEEMTRIEMEHSQAASRLQQEVRNDPLGFLYKQNMSEMAVKSAERILKSPDLLQLAAQRFERESPEFRALQQVAVQRFFQRPFTRLGDMRTELADPIKGMSEETQALLFPGVTKDMMVQFSKDMEFLFSGGATDISGSLAGGARVMNPGAHLPFPMPSGLSKLMVSLPGVSLVHRLLLGKVYAMTMDAVSHPNFAHWLADNLKGSPEEREIARAVVQERLRAAGIIGAAAGQKNLGGPSNQYMQPPQENSQDGMQVPRLAEGGVVTQPTVAMIGEAGPEAVVPLDNPAMAQQAADVAATRTRAPYARAAARPTGLLEGLDELGGYFGNKLMGAMTAPRDALTGALQVNDPATGMPTPEAMQRGQGVANLAMTGGIPMAQRGALGMAGGKLGGPKEDPLASLRESAMQAGQPGVKDKLPPPKNLLDRAWDNYTKRMTESEALESEPVWGTAAQIAEQDGVSEAKAFARVMNDWYKRKGVDKRMTEKEANEYTGGARGSALFNALLRRGDAT